MKQWIKQMWEGEIYEIRILLKEWFSIPEVALKVWRNKTTLYRLLSNNWVEYNKVKYRYTWWKGWLNHYGLKVHRLKEWTESPLF